MVRINNNVLTDFYPFFSRHTLPHTSVGLTSCISIVFSFWIFWLIWSLCCLLVHFNTWSKFHNFSLLFILLASELLSINQPVAVEITPCFGWQYLGFAGLWCVCVPMDTSYHVISADWLSASRERWLRRWEGGMGRGALGINHARMCVSKCEGNGSFFSFKWMKWMRKCHSKWVWNLLFQSMYIYG